MFQPTRPPVRWSSVEKVRAVWTGWSSPVPEVNTKPSRFVSYASTGMR